MDRIKGTMWVLACLNHARRRCTYGALAGILGVANQGVGRYLGAPRPEASWVVRKDTGKPSNYAPEQMAEGLCHGCEPITNPEELKRLVCETMNDLHVVHLEYRIVCDPERMDWSEAEAAIFEEEDFTVEVEDQRVLFRFKTHYGTEDEARSVVEPYRNNWEFMAGVSYGPDAFTLRFVRSEIIDCKPIPGDSLKVTGDCEIIMEAKSPVLTVVPSRYPEPPAPGTMTRTPDIDSMYHRYLGYRAGKEPLPSMAYFCLTMLTERMSQSRKDAARRFGICPEVLSKVGRLSSTKGGETARKKEGLKKPYTSNEETFLDAAIQRMIVRAAEIAEEPDTEREQITLDTIRSAGRLRQFR